MITDNVRDRIAELMRADLANADDPMTTDAYRVVLAVMRAATADLAANLPSDNRSLRDDSYDYVSNPIHTLTTARAVLEPMSDFAAPDDAALIELCDDIALYLDDLDDDADAITSLTFVLEYLAELD